MEREAGLAAKGKAASQVSCLPLCCCRRRRCSRHPHPSQSRCGCCASRVALAQRRGEKGREKAEALCLRGGWGGMPGAPCSRGSRKIAPQGSPKPAAERQGRKARPDPPRLLERAGLAGRRRCTRHIACHLTCVNGGESLSTKSPAPSPVRFLCGATGSLFPSFPT